MNGFDLITLFIAAITYGTAAAVRHAGRDPDGKVRQPEPRRGGHYVSWAASLGPRAACSSMRSRVVRPTSSVCRPRRASSVAFLAGAIASLIFSFLTITLRANQNVTGLALSIFGTGVGQFIGEYMRVSDERLHLRERCAQGLLPELPLPQGPAGHSGGRRHPLRQQLLLLPRRCLRRRAVRGTSTRPAAACTCAAWARAPRPRTPPASTSRAISTSPPVIGGGVSGHRRHGLHHDHRGRRVEPRGPFTASAGSPSRWSSSACGVRWARSGAACSSAR